MSDISPVAAPSLSGSGGVAPARAAAAATVTGLEFGLTGGLTSGLGALGGSSTIVDLSSVGQILSATATFQSRLAALHPGSADSGLGQNFGTDFGSLAAEAQNFVDHFNTLQGRLQEPSGSVAGQALAAPFINALNQQATATVANGDSTLTRLAQLGINLETPTASGLGGTLSIDLAALRQAFETDPSGSFSLLDQAVGSFETLAGDFTTQASTQSVTLSTLAQTIALSQTLSLFSNSLFGAGSGGLSGSLANPFASLLLLNSLTGQDSRSTTQQLAAVSQFAMVSSLL